MTRRRSITPCLIAVAFTVIGASMIRSAPAVELTRLSEANWQTHAPAGKEVDAIYGDFLLRNDQVGAVVAQDEPTQHANLRVRHIGGGLLDLTRNDESNDQLTSFDPAPNRELELDGVTVDGRPIDGDFEQLAGNEIALRFRTTAGPAEGSQEEAGLQPTILVTYRLAEGEAALTVDTKYRNDADQPLIIEPVDEIRCEQEFQSGVDDATGAFWAYDRYWRQAYAVLPEDARLEYLVADKKRSAPQLTYSSEEKPLQLAPGESHSMVRRLFAGADQLEVLALAAAQLNRSLGTATITVRDEQGAVADADVTVSRDGETYASGRTSAEGVLDRRLPPGDYAISATHHARGETTANVMIAGGAAESVELQLPTAGYVAGVITDDAGAPIPCKVDFGPLDGQEAPNFGPDSAEFGVRHLVYTPDGKFRVAVRPGRYSLLVSHGPEYDAVEQQIEVAAGEEARCEAQLRRSVDTRGWLSAEYHSHSSPSGDNTASQRGRVMNLLAEHLEFAPCTEHGRITVYDEHLEALGATQRMLSCSGMELTGQPLPLNHQNAFPLVHRPHTQNGGGPEADPNPVVQIERLVMWDDQSDKLVQVNHPNIPQMLGDRDLDGEADGGFEAMFGLMDVIEIHPPHQVFARPDRLPTRANQLENKAFHWLQLLNLGYRIPGVVNTDAHWNYHGSGWLRNFVKSSTDDPAEADVMELVHASEHGQLVMSNGPFLEVAARAAGDDEWTDVGGDLPAEGGDVELRIKVQCPNWLDVNRVQVFVNGRADEPLNFTRATHEAMFGAGTVKFEATVPMKLPSDAHLVVATIGEGLTLGRVIGPGQGKAPPTALANPIFVDVDGDGFRANGDALGLPLPVPARSAHRHTHGHGHTHEGGH